MPEHADTIRWQGFSHEELYKLLHEGAGPAASAGPSRRWAAIAATLSEVGQDLRAAIGQTGSGWTGRAAGRAYDSLSGLVDWAGQTGAQASEMRRLVEEQAEFLARARAEMPVPDGAAPDGATPAAADPTLAPAAQVIASQQDKEPVEAARAAGAQLASEVMAAYERDTTANTSAMASFSAPAELAGVSDVQRNQRSGVQVTTPSVAGAPVLPPPQRDHEPDRGPTRQPGGFGGGGTWGAVAEVEPYRRPVLERGSFTVAAPVNEPIIGATPLGSSGGNQGANRTGSGPRGGRGSVPSTPGIGGTPGFGGGGGTVPGGGPNVFDPLQSAAAGQAVAATGTPAAATPGAAAGTNSSTTGSSADRAGLRRFGVETIGSGQWFGDGPEPEVRGGTSPNRGRWSSREDERVTEQVSIDGEEHNLPPNVIGEGPH